MTIIERIKLKFIKRQVIEPAVAEKWDQKKYQEWKRFWNSEMGKLALAKFEQLKRANMDTTIELAKKGYSSETIAHYASVASGIDVVIQDVLQGMALAQEVGKSDSK